MKKLVLFDFDGTLTNRDSMLEIFKYRSGFLQCVLGFVRYFPLLVAMKVGLCSSKYVKEKLLAYHFGGMSAEDFEKLCIDFANEILPKLIKPNGLEVVKNHLSKGDRVFIVSASLENWIKPWAIQRRIEVIGTKVVDDKGVITGRIEGKNCKGKEKVDRINSLITLDEFEEIIAYGDTKGDKEMLELASKSYYKHF